MQKELNHCLQIIKSGGVILFPTDTIWGLGCDATNEKAVNKVFQIKERDSRKAVVILLYDYNKLFDYVKEIPDIAFDLIELSEEPLTIVYPYAKNLPQKVIADDGSVAIRICKSDACADLLRKFGKPLVATSANLSNEKSPIDFNTISQVILNKADCIYNSTYNSQRQNPSKIIKFNSDATIKIIRN